MKKVCVFLLVSVLMLSAGCVWSGPGGEVEQDEWGLVLGAENVTSTSMTLTCTQSGGHPSGELQTGSPFSIECMEDGEWNPVPTAPGILDWAWTMEGWMIARDETTRWEVNWDFLYGELPPGTYRMAKEIMDFRGPGDFTQKMYYAEFVIVD